MSMAHPEKVAAPEVALSGLVVHVRVAPAGVLSCRVTGAVLVVTPPVAVWIATVGWMPNAIPPVESDGEAVNASLAGVTEIAATQLLPVLTAVDVKAAFAPGMKGAIATIPAQRMSAATETALSVPMLCTRAGMPRRGGPVGSFGTSSGAG